MVLSLAVIVFRRPNGSCLWTAGEPAHGSVVPAHNIRFRRSCRTCWWCPAVPGRVAGRVVGVGLVRALGVEHRCLARFRCACGRVVLSVRSPHRPTLRSRPPPIPLAVNPPPMDGHRVEVDCGRHRRGEDHDIRLQRTNRRKNRARAPLGPVPDGEGPGGVRSRRECRVGCRATTWGLAGCR
jgi:hypothetical protein